MVRLHLAPLHRQKKTYISDHLSHFLPWCNYRSSQWSPLFLFWLSAFSTFLLFNGCPNFFFFPMVFPLFFWLSFHFLSSSFSNHQPAVKIFFSLWCLFLHFSGHHLHFFSQSFSLTLFLSFLAKFFFSLTISLQSPANCQNFPFSNGPFLSFTLCVLFLFLLHRCGCSLQSVLPLLP